MRSALAGLLGLLVPGAGHAFLGRRRAALVFAPPVVALFAGLLILFIQGGEIGALAFVVTPGVLPALAVLNLLLLAWRIAAAVDAARSTNRPWLTTVIVLRLPAGDAIYGPEAAP
jgi:hypothetical protein